MSGKEGGKEGRWLGDNGEESLRTMAVQAKGRRKKE